MRNFIKYLATVYWVIVAGNSLSQPKVLACEPYFRYDAIEHYYKDFGTDDEESIVNAVANNKPLREIIFSGFPDKVSDSGKLKELERLGFAKKVVQANKFSGIDSIFCQKIYEADKIIAVGQITEKGCSAVYRDILIFKKKNKIVGTAKICFTCDKKVIAGTSANTDHFGEGDGYQRLYKLLH